MKIKLGKNKVALLFIAIFIAICVSVLVIVSTTVAHAYTGNSQNLSREQLHTTTTATSVRTDTPAITVFMHGLGGSAKDWSNNGDGTKGSISEFVQDSASIIEKLRNSAPNVKLYRALASYYNATTFTLYSEYGNDIVNNIENFSSHTIIVMEIPSTHYLTIKEIYDRLHYVIDKISYDYYIEKGILPRINLMGHSLGGLINMQYTIEHPKNVASLVSMGTPYNGSGYENIIVEELLKVDDFKMQPCMTGACGHDYYFCNLNTRRNAWNNVYSQNKHIKFLTLSGETSSALIDNIIWSNKFFEEYVGSVAIVGIRAAFANILTLNLVGGLLSGDVCVDIDSQKAKGYDGVINYNKVFTPSNCNLNKRSQDQVPIPHNLETYDVDMHNCILKVIDYGNNIAYDSCSQNGINASIIAKSDNKWLIMLTNNTDSSRCFEYNKKMCFYGDAQKWTGLGHIESTDIIAVGASTIIEIEEYGTATSIAISYDSGSTRYIFYADELNGTSCTMSAYGSAKDYYSYTQNNIKVGILSKYGGIWIVKLTNNTGSERSFFYNKYMCFYNDAKNWSGLYNIMKTVTLSNGESIVLEISENGTATSIVVSYTNGSYRYLFYADNLSTSGTMQSYGNTTRYYTYTQYNMKISIVGKSINKWLIELVNNIGSERSFDYNQNMCFAGNAKNWSGLTNIATTLTIAKGGSYYIEVGENGTATSIAISYTEGNTRSIFYAYDLNKSGTMSSFGSTSTTYSYQKNNIQVGIVGKNVSVWKIKLTNNTGREQNFYYNTKMCFAGDAETWSGLSDIAQTGSIASGESVEIEIQENGTATSIAISYIYGSTRYIFYAYDLDNAGTMSSFESSKPYYSYTKNGMKVSIVGKNGGTWMIELTNNTGVERTFQYNRKMCFAGDAEKWSGLSHVSDVTLKNGMSTTYPLSISEYGTATSIAISYMDGKYRKIFYAYDLDKSGTMSAFESTIDTTNPPSSSCIAAGTLITLANGNQVPVETLTGNETLLVWNMETGMIDYAPIVFIDNEQIGHYEVINLTFSDGVTVNVISEHGFWNVELNKYIYLDKDAEKYIGQHFLRYDGNDLVEVMLTNVEISTDVTVAYSPVTHEHLCYFVNGMLSMPGGINGLFNIFEVDGVTMIYNETAMVVDIEEYGLYTYDEFCEMYQVSEEVFEAFNGRYLKVAIGKGLITKEHIGELIERYSEFF